VSAVTDLQQAIQTGDHYRVAEVVADRPQLATLAALTQAVKAGHLRVVQVLLDVGASPEPGLIAVAAERGYLEVVQLLVSQRRSHALRYVAEAVDAAQQHGRHRCYQLLKTVLERFACRGRHW
jgi:hypothetical protein